MLTKSNLHMHLLKGLNGLFQMVSILYISTTVLTDIFYFTYLTSIYCLQRYFIPFMKKKHRLLLFYISRQCTEYSSAFSSVKKCY